MVKVEDSVVLVGINADYDFTTAGNEDNNVDKDERDEIDVKNENSVDEVVRVHVLNSVVILLPFSVDSLVVVKSVDYSIAKIEKVNYVVVCLVADWIIMEIINYFQVVDIEVIYENVEDNYYEN